MILQLEKLGVPKDFYEIRYNTYVDDTSDPNTLEIYYQPIAPVGHAYIKQRVLLEMGARSLTEPFETQPVLSFIDDNYKDSGFAQAAFNVKVVIPTRTFIEKVLLLHEEFSKPIDKIRTDRLTRHFYDIDKIMNTDFGTEAIKDEELFNTIVQHRKTVTSLRGIDYSNHRKGSLSILPPEEIIKEWEADYKTMRENMIVGESLTWADLLKSIKRIEDSMNNHMKK
ncbi:hypothetical protein D3C81_1457890 [compost metagenome]